MTLATNQFLSLSVCVQNIMIRVKSGAFRIKSRVPNAKFKNTRIYRRK